MLDQSNSKCLIVTPTKVLLGDEVVEVDELHVSALTEGLAEGGLAGGFGSNYARDLGKHGFSGIFINIKHVTVGINSSHLAELFVKVDYWQVLLLVSLEALCNGFIIVVRTTLTAIQEAFGARILGAVEEENILSFADISLKVGALVNFSGEAVDQIVLI